MTLLSIERRRALRAHVEVLLSVAAFAFCAGAAAGPLAGLVTAMLVLFALRATQPAQKPAGHDREHGPADERGIAYASSC